MRGLWFLSLFLGFSMRLMAATGSQGMPWESPLNKIVNSLTGPVAGGIAALAFFIALASLAFGQDLSGFVRSMVILVLVVAGLIGIGSLISMLFGGGVIY